LRELALRAVADEVGEKAASYRAREGLEPALIPERVMVCMSSSPMAPRVIRTGARIAGRLGAKWFAVYVETPHERPGGSVGRIRRRWRGISDWPKAWARLSFASEPNARPRVWLPSPSAKV
jgi:two-component system sensor histidine kinase KdpD